MEPVNQSTTGNEGSQEQNQDQVTTPVDLSATNGTEQSKDESLPDAEKDETQPDQPQAEVTKETPVAPPLDHYAELVKTFNSIKGSLNASHQAQLSGKISSLGSFLENELPKIQSGSNDATNEKISELENQVQLHKESAENSEKLVAFYETQLSEAKETITKLNEEIARLNTPALTPVKEG